MENKKERQALEAVRAEMKGLPGHLGFYYKNLVTGVTDGQGADEAYLAASVIKLPLFLHVLTQAARGTLSLEDRLTVTPEEKVPSCGALYLFDGTVEADIKALCRLMICISDNTATNRLIRHCTIEGTNKGFREMGLEKTVLRRRLFDAEASAAGIQNTICPAEMGRLLEQLYRHAFVSPDVSRQALEVLLLQQIGHKLDGKLCGRFPIAHKTGEDDALSNDVGIVYAKQPFVLCFAGHDTDVYRWEDLIRRSAWALAMAQEEDA